MSLSVGVMQGAWPQAAGLLAAMEATDEPAVPEAAQAQAQPTLADLYMADPLMAELMATLGGDAPPATSGLARAQVQNLGQDRFDRLCRLSNALHAVRDQYAAALGQAALRGEGPGWVDHVVPIYPPDEHQAYAEPIGSSIERRFEPDAFTAWYTRQDGLTNRAFAELFGQSHTDTELDQWGLRVIREITFDNPNWSLGSVGGPLMHGALTAIDPDTPPELNDAGAVGFDLEVGWATAAGNVHRDADWLDSAAQLAMVGTVAWLSAGTLGPSAAAAMGLSTATAAGAAVAAAAVGGATSLAGGLTSGNLSVKGVLQGALSGALTAGLGQALAPGLASLGDAGTVAARGTVQGAVQALMGGSFRDGAVAGLASGLAEVAVGHVEAGIAQAVGNGTMGADDVFQARMAARLMGSAIRALASPDPAGQAFAQGVLQDLLGQMMGPPGGDPLPKQASTMQAPDSALGRAQEERLQSGITITDFGDPTAVAGDVTAAAGASLRLQGDSLTFRISGRTAYLGAEPLPRPEDAAAGFRREQAALNQVLEAAAQAQVVGLDGATGDPAAGQALVAPELPLGGSGTIRALGGADAFFTLNPAGRLLQGLGHGTADLMLAPIGMGREVWLTASDAVGQVGVGARNLLTGSDGYYRPQSALGRTVEAEGLLGAVGLGVTGAVRGLLAPVDALYRQDIEALGRSLPGAALAAAPLGWGTRVSAAQGLTVEEAAIVERGNPARFRIIDVVTEAAQPAVEAILQLDPDAVVGFRGSLATGLKNETKLGPYLERVAYNSDVAFCKDVQTGAISKYEGAQGYDIDLFVVSDKLAARFEKRAWFRSLGSRDDVLRQVFVDLGVNLRDNPLLDRLKSEDITFRVFTSKEMSGKVLRGDQPYYLNMQTNP